MTKRLLIAAAAIVVAPLLATAPLVASAQGGHDHAGERTIYTCGMHPQIVADEPGTCPICGMDLTPKKVAGAAGSDRAAEDGVKRERRIKHWVAPMDPTFISDKPGTSPMGMSLIPVYESAGGGSTITINPVVVQNMGVRIARAERGSIFRHVRTIGTVDIAEDEVSVVNLRYSGWVERLYVDKTGVQVKAGKVLFDIYSPELMSAQEEYLLALRSGPAQSPLIKSARRRLEYFDLSAWHIEQIEKAGKPLRTLHVVAPRTGYVLHKNVVQGARVMAGADLYRIGNLAKIWVNADVYEFDAPWIAEGQKASMELSFQAGKTYDGKVAYIYPTLNPKSRTLTVRLEFQNPGLGLKPGMFATVQIEAQRQQDVLKIPTEAIIRSGTRQVVFVAIDLGHYEMREITTGLSGDRHMTEVLSGISEGERVVTSGQFLLDSESQLQEAVQKLLETRLHYKEKRVTADGVDSQRGEPAGETYWTCGMHPQVVQDEPGTCPICGMDLIAKKK